MNQVAHCVPLLKNEVRSLKRGGIGIEIGFQNDTKSVNSSDGTIEIDNRCPGHQQPNCRRSVNKTPVERDSTGAVEKDSDSTDAVEEKRDSTDAVEEERDSTDAVEEESDSTAAFE